MTDAQRFWPNPGPAGGLPQAETFETLPALAARLHQALAGRHVILQTLAVMPRHGPPPTGVALIHAVDARGVTQTLGSLHAAGHTVHDLRRTLERLAADTAVAA